MSENISPIKPSGKGAYVDTTGKSKPGGVPKADKNFRKLMKDDEKEKVVDAAEEIEEAEEESDGAPTLFDLSKKPTKPVVKAPVQEEPIETPEDESELIAELPQPPPKVIAKQEPKKMPAEPKTVTEADAKAMKPVLEDKDQDLDNVGNNEDADLAFETPQKDTKVAKEEPQPHTVVDHDAEVDHDDVKDKHLLNFAKEPKVVDDVSINEAGRQATAMNAAPKKPREKELGLEYSSINEPSNKAKTKVASKTKDNFMEDRQDIAAINPNKQNISFSTDTPKMDEQTEQSTMRELAMRIIEKIQTMRTEGKTDTIVTLRYPPILEGSTITLSALDGAKREFNLSFAGLTDAGKAFLDLKIAEGNLSQQLERKGIVLHTVTTSTLAEIPITTESSESRFAQDQQKDQQQQQQDQQQKQRQNQTFDSEYTV